MGGDCPLWLGINVFGWISPNREGATPPKDNSPPQRVVPPLEDIHHPQSVVTNLKNILENAYFISTLQILFGEHFFGQNFFWQTFFLANIFLANIFFGGDILIRLI